MKRKRRVEIRVERHELSIFSNYDPSFAGQPGGPVSGSEPNPDPASNPVPNRASTQLGRPGQSGLPLSPRPASPASPASSASPLSPFCPVCGSQSMLPLSDAFAVAGLTGEQFKSGLESGAFHLHFSPGGEWWVCGQSLRPG